jgi:LysR family glycine cleavage system transcriptional activator
VSHQIKALEDHLGLSLFERTKGTLLLSDAGQAILPGIRDGFDRFDAALEAVDNLGDAGVLTVSVAPSFAAKWLLPRLDRFQTAFPDIDVRVAASMTLTDFQRDGVDLAIRYGAGRYPGLHVERVLAETVFPVCSPKLALALPGDLAHATLLHDDSPDEDPSFPTWPMWLKAAGLAAIDGTRGPRFNQSSLVVEAAVRGRGIALGKARLAAEDLAAGNLVKPFGEGVAVDFAYYIVCPTAKLVLRKVSSFCDWLRAEASVDGAKSGSQPA